MTSLHYSKAMAFSAAVVGSLLLAVGLLALAPLQIIAGFLLALVGVLMLRNPMVVLGDTEVQVRSPLGFTVRRFPISGPQDLRVQGKRLLHVPTGKKISSLGFGVRQDEVEELKVFVPSEGRAS